jgi:hypothetical protein
MLNDKSRVTLFWFSIGMIIVVVLVAVITLLRACGRPGLTEPPLTVSPAEVNLCPGESQSFTVSGDVQVSWEATGGTISEGGTFTAGGTPGEYAVTASESDSRRIAKALVYVVACTPTPSPTPSPTPESTPTPLSPDPPGDVVTYDTAALAEGYPNGVDIRDASIRPNLRVRLESTRDAPEELADWVEEGEVLLWITFYQPIPDPPPYFDWLFSLDVDGDTATGRPVDSARINPDLGDDAVVGVLYDSAEGQYAPYFLAWDSTEEAWVDGPEEVRFYIDDSRTLIAMALPLETLTQTVAETTGATLASDAIKGRAAALSFAGEQRVIDFYPDRPE